eukprot:CAMPEP_0170455152 /NCGR_PEP_ID=MMETSP0123-20130129/3191_1 /TAXON_ID=182087 /ORGANISM="Favella ehrenbergii, Strain Fehren 1" /LENGTH=72 /DNA_ID=CAMNT_0010718153 /DNA_START=227 /DNA_END=445 /DNA_ORIENTATION=-
MIPKCEFRGQNRIALSALLTLILVPEDTSHDEASQVRHAAEDDSAAAAAPDGHEEGAKKHQNDANGQAQVQN